MLYLCEHQPKQNLSAFLHITLQDTTTTTVCELKSLLSTNCLNGPKEAVNKYSVGEDGTPKIFPTTDRWNLMWRSAWFLGFFFLATVWHQTIHPSMDKITTWTFFFKSSSDLIWVSSRLICLLTSTWLQILIITGTVTILFLTRSSTDKDKRSLINSGESFGGSFFFHHWEIREYSSYRGKCLGKDRDDWRVLGIQCAGKDKTQKIYWTIMRCVQLNNYIRASAHRTRDIKYKRPNCECEMVSGPLRDPECV